ncbi:MAG: pentapeptide repeat-containing protein [Tateyamaria sp.]|uniref:pentapeptide repeat-containing protein n=1 Tax=Tateyamaria sp. TaxID=1929288 RepID=UPI00329F145D
METTTLTLPFAPNLVWGTLGLLGIALACVVVFTFMPSHNDRRKYTQKFRDWFQRRPLRSIILVTQCIFALVVVLAWVLLAYVLFTGLFELILTVLNEASPNRDDKDEVWEFRFKLVQITALTTVLAAIVALPLTVIRLRLTQKQTYTATESLFNEKINAATQGLYARRQVTEWRRGQSHDFWQDDIVQRCAAIDRLEGLARENNAETPRIARLLSVYVCELSSDVQPQTPPSDATPEKLEYWARQLPKPRSDMEKAAQTLGRLHKYALSPLDNGEIDLRGANLQKCDLKGLVFDKALFQDAELQGANLGHAELQGAYLGDAQLQGTDLGHAELQGAYLRDAQLQGAYLRDAQLQGAYLSDAQLQAANLNRAQLQAADLIHAELQGAYLSDAQLQAADLSGAQLQGADLIHAQLQRAYLSGAQFDAATSLTAAVFQGAAVKEVDFTNIPQITEHLNDVFGDDSTTPPTDIARPDHWLGENLNYDDFHTEWRAWQATRPEGWDE